MIRVILAATAAMLMAGPAYAQDYTGNVDPSTYSLPTVMHSAIDARAKRDARPTRKGLSPRSAKGCADLPKFRARYGASDWRVMRLTRLCREAGAIR